MQKIEADKKVIINMGTDPLGHNIHREGRSRLIRLVPWIKTNHINFGFIRACNDNSIQAIHNIFANRYTKSIPQTETNTINLAFTRILL